MDYQYNLAQSLLQETPPPSLRDIIYAYRTKGDGDRNLLLAMLNAKAAEDQRLANTAGLHKSLLDLYQFERTADSAGSPHIGLAPYPNPSTLSTNHYASSAHRYRNHTHSAHHPYRYSPPASLPKLNPIYSPPSHPSGEPPRKRHRPPNTPPPPREQARSPPSPQSSHSSVNAERSPRPGNRGSTTMAIGSLLREELRSSSSSDHISPPGRDSASDSDSRILPNPEPQMKATPPHHGKHSPRSAPEQ